jgi:hypothetical protein
MSITMIGLDTASWIGFRPQFARVICYWIGQRLSGQKPPYRCCHGDGGTESSLPALPSLRLDAERPLLSCVDRRAHVRNGREAVGAEQRQTSAPEIAEWAVYDHVGSGAARKSNSVSVNTAVSAVVSREP